LRDAVARALQYVHTAIERAPGIGKGMGPLDHFFALRPFELHHNHE
jgi:hydroxymethylpyrimidine/phosphomethylpyrimidine kinase